MVSTWIQNVGLSSLKYSTKSVAFYHCSISFQKDVAFTKHREVGNEFSSTPIISKNVELLIFIDLMVNIGQAKVKVHQVESYKFKIKVLKSG